MSKSFSAQVEAFVLETEKRLNALIRQSVQDVIDIAQLSDDKGGKMRIDTGFLRASGQLSFSGMPSGPVRGDKKEPNSYDFDNGPIELTLGNADVGVTIYFGWTANYAEYREAFDGFLLSAVDQWQEIVTKNANEIRRRAGG